MNIVAEMLLTEPAPAAIWITLMLLTMPALVVLANPDGARNPRVALLDTVNFVRRYPARQRARSARRAAEAAQAVRYAQEVRVAARRAGEAADRWQEHWEAASERVDAAWAARLEADERWARCRATAAFGTPSTPQNPAEYADRERFLHNAVRSAVSRGELPATAVDEALAGLAGWDATLHPVEQEMVLNRARATHLAGQHEAALTAERSAWHDVQLARRTRDSLHREAALAESLLPPTAISTLAAPVLAPAL
ncbi:MAG TPA: hypothetical protein VN408_30095 [Actinoplanes sp.]|nr:hypothetical protein [Actinoplanes sp.]